MNIELNNQLGYEIRNQDGLCEEVKKKIVEVGKAEYMIKRVKVGGRKNEKQNDDNNKNKREN